ncbi:universal stress protein [Pseudomonas citronellolis]|uniref:universal stress protein n=1 Tax=Pseudomonas citronellolis TaxID=53408 RepID=UPI0023E46642|nr:universal stress protein [Pseudomonas citronellolis]MDF3937033.1 universal stress protein [Pseudomonas citronellolis]
MLKSLLIATDLSSRSEKALQRAGALAKRFGCPWTVLSVVDEDQPAALVQQEATQVRLLLEARLVELTELGGSCPRIRVEVGDPNQKIVASALEEDAELLVMGAHRKSTLRDIFVGTTVERVVRAGKLPVLMVNQPAAGEYRDLLLALDTSPASANAVRVAERLGLLQGAVRRAIYAFSPLAKGMMQYSGVSEERIDEFVGTETRQAVDEFKAFLRDQQLEPWVDEQLVAVGLPGNVLERLAEKHRPDLLVMGTRGMGGVKRALIGSVADYALRELDCDILVVPPDTGV